MNQKREKFIVWFEEVNKEDVSIVGGKGANLGEMTNAGFPIPYGFVVTAKAFFYFIESNKLNGQIYPLLKNINYNRPEELQQVSDLIQNKIYHSPIPDDLEKAIIHYYEHIIDHENKLLKKSQIANVIRKFSSLFNHPYVAIRSSATAEDLPSASFAGQQETFLNVRGEINLLKKVKECWASLFTPRSIYYRHQQGFNHEKVGLAIVVQRMIQSEKSGIAFTVDPTTNNKNTMVIEAIFGLGEYIVGGKVTPDHYEVDKHSLVITKKEIKPQKIKLVKKATKNIEEKLTKHEGYHQKLSNKEILEIALLIKEIEKHYYFPQDIEWAIENNQLFIVQSRPITTISNHLSSGQQIKTAVEPILIGAPASPGVKYGPVKKINSAKEIGIINSGDVLVAPQTNPDYVPAMKKAAAIVTEHGGRTSHAAIVSRELGIPAVVGAENAMKILKDHEIITVNGSTGEVFRGKVLFASNEKSLTKDKITTNTKIYVNLAETEEIKKVSKLDVDGVGLLRAEFIIANIGIHPKSFIKSKTEHIFIGKLYQDLLKFARGFSPKPVIYRATDFKTNEYRHLQHGSYYEPKEENPMLGFRGAYRYINDPQIFMMELEAIKKVYQDGFGNLHLMIPFVRVPWELIQIKKLVEKSGLTNFKSFKLFMMVEVPATALQIEEFLKIGIDGISIGSNDLTMMLLGVDRDNSEVASLFDERNPVVLQIIKYIISEANKYHVPVSICGQAPSDFPELVEELVKGGISSISVNPDAVSRTRKFVSQIEKKLKRNLYDND
jgi:pyruvate,water dikinase